jgi:hypothetical protein
MARTIRDILGSDNYLGGPGPESSGLGAPGVAKNVTFMQKQNGGGSPAIDAGGNVPFGSETGAPPFTRFRMYQVAPFGFNLDPTNIVEADRQARIVVLTAPLVGFTIYVGDPGVSPQNGFGIVPALPYEIIIPGNQNLYAITDAPVYVPLRVQISAVYVGGRERRMG